MKVFDSANSSGLNASVTVASSAIRRSQPSARSSAPNVQMPSAPATSVATRSTVNDAPNGRLNSAPHSTCVTSVVEVQSVGWKWPV